MRTVHDEFLHDEEPGGYTISSRQLRGHHARQAEHARTDQFVAPATLGALALEDLRRSGRALVARRTLDRTLDLAPADWDALAAGWCRARYTLDGAPMGLDGSPVLERLLPMLARSLQVLDGPARWDARLLLRRHPAAAGAVTLLRGRAGGVVHAILPAAGHGHGPVVTLSPTA